MPVGFVAIDHQTGLDQRLVAIVVKHGLKVLPFFRRKTQTEMRRDFARQTAPFQVIDRLGRAAQLLAVIIAGHPHRVAQAGGHRRLGASRRAITADGRGFARHRHAHRLRQVRYRLGKTQAGVLHQETDGGAVRATTEAMIKLLGRADRKRRAFLVMERAQTHKIGAALLQLHKTADHLDNVDAI